MNNFNEIINSLKSISCDCPLKQNGEITEIAVKYSLTWDKIMHLIDIDVLKFDDDLNILVSDKILNFQI